ncbi:MAG: hypothetical protein PHV68_02590, partial [Candidatus Gastranaerophilales bacterium]|nr:hypothetical protein [Candidatus Gastranaerophilales bacterium]
YSLEKYIITKIKELHKQRIIFYSQNDRIKSGKKMEYEKMSDFYNNVRTRAYYKYLNRINYNIPGNENSDWEEAQREQIIYDRIEEEAFLHYKNNCYDAEWNWILAEKEINERIQFLAFYLHEANYNKKPYENWIDAQRLYINEF